jgi:hypothetical protein
MDKAPDYGSGEWGFESLWMHARLAQWESTGPTNRGRGSDSFAEYGCRHPGTPCVGGRVWSIAPRCKRGPTGTVVRIHPGARTSPAADLPLSSEARLPGSTLGGDTTTHAPPAAGGGPQSRRHLGFDSPMRLPWPVAQRTEQPPPKRHRAGSSPARPADVSRSWSCGGRPPPQLPAGQSAAGESEDEARP